MLQSYEMMWSEKEFVITSKNAISVRQPQPIFIFFLQNNGLLAPATVINLTKTAIQGGQTSHNHKRCCELGQKSLGIENFIGSALNVFQILFVIMFKTDFNLRYNLKLHPNKITMLDNNIASTFNNIPLHIRSSLNVKLFKIQRLDIAVFM